VRHWQQEQPSGERKTLLKKPGRNGRSSKQQSAKITRNHFEEVSTVSGEPRRSAIDAVVLAFIHVRSGDV